MNDQTKLEEYLKSKQHTKCCGSPVVHIAQVVFLKCDRCHKPLSNSISLQQAKDLYL